jgi:hypothetical protein
MSVPPTSERDDFLETELARGFTIREYLSAKASSPPGQKQIAQAIKRRFVDRYLDPIQANPNGFTMMAVSCLMIEALESFNQGLVSTTGVSQRAFQSFFDRVETFGEFRALCPEFYSHVRCGILHQAETTAGWRIRRDGPLFNQPRVTINAKAFVEALQAELHRFCYELEELPWDGPQWTRVRKKLDAIVENSRRVS